MKNISRTPYQKAQSIALSMLSRRRHSREELRQKLADRGFDAGIIEAVLSECEAYRYIDDETAADYFVEELIRKQVGLLRIQDAMNRRGFTRELTARMMEEHDLSHRELEIAKGALDKKRNALLREKDDWKRREKTVRFLRSRGFQTATISTLLATETDLFSNNSP